MPKFEPEVLAKKRVHNPLMRVAGPLKVCLGSFAVFNLLIFLVAAAGEGSLEVWAGFGFAAWFWWWAIGKLFHKIDLVFSR